MKFNKNNFLYEYYRSLRDLLLSNFELFHLRSLRYLKKLNVYSDLKIFLTFYTRPLETKLTKVA